MYFDNLDAFLQMGRHGAFVWSAYACFVLVLLVNAWHVHMKKAKAWKSVSDAIRREARRQEREGKTGD